MTKTRTIREWFSSLVKAEKYQNELYECFGYVRLTTRPRFTEEGFYEWEVR